MKKRWQHCGCVLALFLLALLLWQWPQVRAWNERQNVRPQENLEMVRIWTCAQGDGMEMIRHCAAKTEKACRGVRMIIRRVPEGEWEKEGAVLPEVLVLQGGNREVEGFSLHSCSTPELSILFRKAHGEEESGWRRDFGNLLQEAMRKSEDA